MDPFTYGDLLNSPKDGPMLGVQESPAFVLSLRDKTEFTRLHSSGFHCIPQLGTYGQDYRLHQPLVLISLPATTSYLQKLPPDVLNALDLDQYVPSHLLNSESLLTPPNTPMLANSHQFGAETPADALIRSTAQQLVRTALLNAYNRMLYGAKLLDDIATRIEAMSIDTNSQIDTRACDWTLPKTQGSSVSLESEGYASASSGLSTARKLSFQDQVEMETNNEELELELRVIAKKLVNKALHFACKTLESQNRRSSIEYLIASTKRMKIAKSPSPPPTMHEEHGDSNHPSHRASRLKWNTRSPSPESARLRKLGSKRQRSGSHDIAMQADLNFKKPFSVGQNDTEPRHVLSVHSRVGGSTGSSALASVAFNMARMSITEELESDTATESDEESYTILDSVTCQPTTDTARTSHEHEIAHLKSVSPVGSPDNHRVLTQQVPTIVLSHITADSESIQDSPSVPDSIIPDMDLFVIVHSYPPPGLCQKFLCSNTNEVNLVYHCWLYRDAPFVPELTLSSSLEMGVFCPNGVEPVHLDLQDAGTSFHLLDSRTVCIHNSCFSPENAQLQLLPEHEQTFCTFFSAAKHEQRRVVVFHAVPTNRLVEEQVKDSVQRSHTLGQLLYSLRNSLPEIGEMLAQLVLCGN